MSRELYDPYGALSAALIGMRMHDELSRGSGRTSTMINAALETGGVIICDNQLAGYIHKLIRMGQSRARPVRLEVVPPEEYHQIDRYVRHGPVYFDHHWLYRVQEFKIMEASAYLQQVMQRFPSPLFHLEERLNTSIIRDYNRVGAPLARWIDPNDPLQKIKP